MNIKILETEVLEKIKKNNFDFTYDEMTIIAIKENLSFEFLKKMKNNEKLIKPNVKVIKFIISNLPENCDVNLQNMILDIVSLSREFIYDEIDSGNVNITNEYDDEILNYLIKKLEDSQYKLKKFEYEVLNIDDLINLLLDQKNFLPIIRINKEVSSFQISKDCFQRILSEFPFDTYPLEFSKFGFPEVEYGDIAYGQIAKMKLEYIENLSFGNIVNLINKHIISFEQYVDLIMQKVKDDRCNIEVISFNDGQILRKLTVEQRLEVISSALKKKNISLLFNNYILYDDNVIKEICKIIRNGYKIGNEMITNQLLLNNIEFVQTLIQNGYIKQAQNSNLFDLEYAKKMIMKAINENNVHFLSNLRLNNSKDFIDEMKSLINTGNFNCLNINYSDVIDDEIIELIYSKILELSLDKVKEIKFNEFGISEIFSSAQRQKLHNLLLDNKQYDKAIFFSVTYDPFGENDKEFEAIKNSLYYTNEFFNLNRYYVVYNRELRNMFFNIDMRYVENILFDIYNDESLINLYDDELFNDVKRFFIDKYNLDAGHLEILKEKFGPLITRYLSNEQIRKIINLDYEKFSKLINLFPRKKYEMADLEAIYDSFKQEEFSKDNPDIINIFADISHSLQAKDNKYKELILELKTTWSDKLIKKVLKKYSDQVQVISNDDYMEHLIFKLNTTSGKEYEKYLDIVHIMCNHYIAVKREEYRLTYDMINDLNLSYTYDLKDVIKEVIKLLLKVNMDFKSKVINKLEGIGISSELSLEIIDYYITKDNKKYLDRDDVKKNINKLIKVSQEVLSSDDLKNYKNLAINQAQNLKKKYYVSDAFVDIYSILSKIRLEMIENNLLDDNHKDEYEMLKRIMEKYKLDMLPLEVNTLIKKDTYELQCDLSDLSTFISFFYDIYGTLKSKLQSQNKNVDDMTLTIMNIFKYIDKYSNVSSIYAQILGSCDAGLIREDPSPNNSSGISKEDRLKKAIEKTFSNFKRKTVSVPTFICDVKTNHDKKITAIVGNFTKPTNLTHGERTGSCMRIGGVGYALFDSNQIFHIEFNDPITGKYISRVTGFRNGNTVFLNELRNSCDKSLYSDFDIVEACGNVANELIERSKNSSYPIENVVVHRAYAMEVVPDNRVHLNVKNIKKGLPYFYTDVDSYVHVLATTKLPFAPVVLDNSRVPNYLPVREVVRRGDDKLIIEQINRVHTINLALNNIDYIAEPITDIVYGIVGEDFYVYIDKNLDVKYEMMSRDERCKKEFSRALEDINNYIPKRDVKYAI